MRLICPNCDAEYEVDDSAIPDTGRDVQCSNCGHAWFQLPPEIELALAQEDELFGNAASLDPLPDLQMTDLPDLAPSRELSREPSREPSEPAAPAAPPLEPARRPVDENLLAILREEAEREAAARRAEGPPLETQPDLGLAAPPPAVPGAPGSAAWRIAQIKGDPAEPAAPSPARPAARRDLLPDIEEINSTFKGGDPQSADAPSAPVRSGRGFRAGFVFALVLAASAAAVYVTAPRIAAELPQAQPALTTYVAAVDDARVRLDIAIRDATKAVRALAARLAGQTPAP